MLAGCALPHRIPQNGAATPPTPAPAEPVAAAPAPAITSISAQPLPQLQPLRGTAIQSQAPLHRVDGMPLPQLPQLGAHSETPTAATKTAGAASAGSDVQRARTALTDLNNRANLDDTQVKRMRTAQAALSAGNAERAASLAVPLDARVRRATLAHTVTAGESLWTIAAGPKAYGNGYLWPLIWNANRARLPDPSSLPSGVKLSIPLYPTLPQTAAALDYSHRHPLKGAPNPTGPN